MEYDKILCRFGETVLKGSYTRKVFEDKLVSNIKKGLESKKIKFSLKKEPGRLFIKTKEINESCKLLVRVFGLTSISPVKELKIKSDVRKIVDFSEKFSKEFIDSGEKFAVRARRTGNDGFTSQMIERKVGERVIEVTGAKVDLDKPDKTLYIEVRQNKAYFFIERMNCPGGLPIGTQGKVVVLFSGGIDSPVAAWSILKRGCELVYLHIDNSPYSKDIGRTKKVLKDLSKWSIGHPTKLVKIKSGGFLEEVKEKCSDNMTCLLCKRNMYRIAENLCREEGAKAIVTGENLGQVASQTLDNIRVLNQSIDLPVLRPLIGLNKEEIISIARKIGTYENSIEDAAECKAVPESPRTKGRLSEISREEKKIDLKKIMEMEMKTMKTFNIGKTK